MGPERPRAEMSTPEEHLDVVVGEDGSLARVGADELARLGVRPGERLQLVRTPELTPRRRKSLQGAVVGQVSEEDLLTREDFEATHEANVEAAERKFGEFA